MRDHRKLRAFQIADEVVLATYRATATFPAEEKFDLASQMRRAAVSVASNIVEGCARNSQSDYLRFLDMAFASCRELTYQVSVAARLKYWNEAVQKSIELQCDELSRVLAGLIQSLKKATHVE